MTDIRALALSKGLTDHQADIAVAFVALCEGVARIQSAIASTMSYRQPDWCDRDPNDRIDIQIDGIANRATHAANAGLCAGLHNLGLSLSPKAGDRMFLIIDRLNRPFCQSERAGYVADLVDLCRTAPAAKPAPPPHLRHAYSPPVTIVPYWQNYLDVTDGLGDPFWTPGVVM